MPVVIVKKVQGMPEVLHVTVRGTDKNNQPLEERVEITRGVPTHVSDVILNALKRSDHEHVEVEEEKSEAEKEEVSEKAEA